MNMKKIRIPQWIRSTASVTAMIVVGLTKAILDIAGAFNGPDSRDDSIDYSHRPDLGKVHNQYNWNGSLNNDGNPESYK